MDRIIELAEKYADEMIENRRKIRNRSEKRICQNRDTGNDIW